MNRMHRSTTLAPLLALGAIAAPPQAPIGEAPDYAAAPLVFTGTLTAQEEGPTGMSFPPMYTGRLAFEVEEGLRGDVERGRPLALGYARRQEEPPAFPVGRKCLVTATPGREGPTVLTVEPADAASVAAAREAVAVPIGWTREGGGWRSPWADLGEAAWPKGAVASRRPCCTRTGRPALLAGSGVLLTVEPVPPKRAIEWTNPDGDGEIRVTVSNPGREPVAIPALLRAGDRILWAESLVIRCGGRTYPAPGSHGIGVLPESVVLKPGESVSTVVNIFRLHGPDWPGGGNRIEFQFCLGERSAVQSFYYMARHHDRLRAEAPHEK